jgi:hypothetical protein
MFGENPVDGRNPIGTIVTSRTTLIDSHAALLTICLTLFTLQSFTPDSDS